MNIIKALSKDKNVLIDSYRTLNNHLTNGQVVFFNPEPRSGLDSLYSLEKYPGGKILRPPCIAVYMGSGASHSWLWFVDILENMGFDDIIFLDEHDVSDGALHDRDTLLISGGETFALAHGLGLTGRNEIVNFLKVGGLYFGSCAGACMMMKSTSEPLGLFDLVEVRIANIVDELPEAAKPSNKYSSPYGCAYVFHPVREDISLKSMGIPPFYSKDHFVAPLYGGPPMEESSDAISLALYSDFTPKTDFLSSPEKAREILLGKTAVLMKKYHKGHIILSGPHLEHPLYPEANTIIADSIFYSLSEKNINNNKKLPLREIDANDLQTLKREISNIRITAFALERTPLSWKIGRKYYEPEKISTYAESIWKRIFTMGKMARSGILHGGNPELIKNAGANAVKCTTIIRTLKKMVDNKEPSDHVATELFYHLRLLAKDFFSYYFSFIPIPPKQDINLLPHLIKDKKNL